MWDCNGMNGHLEGCEGIIQIDDLEGKELLREIRMTSEVNSGCKEG